MQYNPIRRFLFVFGLISCMLSLGLTMVSRDAIAESLPITIDGLYDDWDGASLSYQDTNGDDGSSGIDLGRLWVGDDPRFLFLRIETGIELLLNSGHDLVLYLDTDANQTTGLAVGGIGAELEWRFGARQGTFHHNGQHAITQSDILFRAAPTVTGSEFEMAIGRDTQPNGSDPLFLGPDVRILFRDEQGSGDRLPNSGETITYSLDTGNLPPEEPIPFARQMAGDLRITTWNVLSDSPWDGADQPRFGRIISAIDPTILNFQEIYNHTPEETALLIEDWLPSGGGENWFAAGNNDCHTISRYPIQDTWSLDGNLAVLIDTTPVLGSELLIVNAHLPCCSNDAGRQAEIDAILSFLRDAKSPGGQVTLPNETPFMVTGDLNLVGLSQQLTSLLTGDVVDEGTYGPDFDPDWDDSPLADLISRQTEMRMAYTWRSESSTYWPGRLDFAIYTDAVVDVGNHFTVYTQEMSADSLAAHGLHQDDSVASDHLVSCFDFRPSVPSDSSDQVDDLPTAVGLRLEPNPSRQGMRIVMEIPSATSILLEVYDASGRRVAEPLGSEWNEMPAGPWILEWNGQDADGRTVPAGAYFVRLRTRSGSEESMVVRKGTLLR